MLKRQRSSSSLLTILLLQVASRKSKFIAGIFRIITEKQFSGSIVLDIEGKEEQNYESTNVKSGESILYCASLVNRTPN
jgi:hypothetical protein